MTIYHHVAEQGADPRRDRRPGLRRDRPARHGPRLDARRSGDAASRRAGARPASVGAAADGVADLARAGDAAPSRRRARLPARAAGFSLAHDRPRLRRPRQLRLRLRPAGGSLPFLGDADLSQLADQILQAFPAEATPTSSSSPPSTSSSPGTPSGAPSRSGSTSSSTGSQAAPPSRSEMWQAPGRRGHSATPEDLSLRPEAPVRPQTKAAVRKGQGTVWRRTR